MFAVAEMLRRFRARGAQISAGAVPFQLQDGRLATSPYDDIDPLTGQAIKQTLYNCSAPFKDNLWVRREPLSSECGYIEKAVRNGGFWSLTGDVIPFAQDPSIMVGGGIPLLTWNNAVPSKENPKEFTVHQHIAELKNPNRIIARGPLGQKGCRLLDLPDGKIAVVGRKQEWNLGNRGQFTYTEIDSLDQLQDAIPQATPITDVVDRECWVGANQLLSLGKNTRQFAILGHVARFNPQLQLRGIDAKQYYPVIAIFDRIKCQIVAMEIIADAADEHFPLPATTKMASLLHVIYPGGLALGESGLTKYRLFGGVGDVYSVWMDIDIPLLEEYTY